MLLNSWCRSAESRSCCTHLPFHESLGLWVKFRASIRVPTSQASTTLSTTSGQISMPATRTGFPSMSISMTRSSLCPSPTARSTGRHFSSPTSAASTTSCGSRRATAASMSSLGRLISTLRRSRTKPMHGWERDSRSRSSWPTIGLHCG